MPAPCAVRGCVNSGGGRHPPKTRRYKVPKKEPARTAWLRLIGRSDVLPDIEITVCSLHFRPDDYELNMSLAETSGVGKFLARLKPGVTPSLNLPTSGQHAAQQENKAPHFGNEEHSCVSGTVSSSPVVTSPLSQHVSYKWLHDLYDAGRCGKYYKITRDASSGNEERSHAPGAVSFPVLASLPLYGTPESVPRCANGGCCQLRGKSPTQEKGTQYCPPKESKWTQTTLAQT
ncbi:uncharacterized protein LOC135375149 isoform X1 [Ornithodoros turicata]|uniref:uncharacterized protein LOC135375149 isoform X1 n=1 Tax=Ornithodoros turicata TaxID=34597 RepID=UPI003139BC7B